jgi:DNA-binding NarL/FixJ family response regulator
LNARDIVLVVDDSPGTLGMLNDALDEAGFTVLVAADGASAVALVERVTPDIILMDALMPGMDGFETCRRIKQNHSLAGVPVIFMTGLKDTESVVKGLQAGGVDYVTKPAAPDEIIARIQVHLANARAARGAHLALDTTGRFLLAADADGRVRWCTPQAARLLPEGANGAAPSLPDCVRQWLALQSGDAPTPAFRLAGRSGALEISCIGRVGPGEFLLRLVEAEPPGDAARLKQRLGVTTREAEVLLWLARGKQNRDIAEILGMSPRTVNKHLEQVYVKLGVENRAAATGLAIRAIDDG